MAAQSERSALGPSAAVATSWNLSDYIQGDGL